MRGTYERAFEDAVIGRDGEEPGLSLSTAAAMRQFLNRNQRETLYLHCVKKMSVTEIARRRGVYPSTVSRTISRARAKLADVMRICGADIRF